MNYTGALRKYCADHNGAIFDAAFVHEHYFPLIKYRTFIKILSRLEEDKILVKVDKGIYLIAAEEKNFDKAVYDFYVENCNGMVIGYKLYNELGITEHISNTIEIYTNRLPNGKQKNVRNYHLIGANLMFLEETKRLITLMELIEKHSKIIDLDVKNYAKVRKSIAKIYSEEQVARITRAIPYQHGTIEIVKNEDPFNLLSL